MNVLVTGGNGFLGIYIIEALLEQGYNTSYLTRSKDVSLRLSGATPIFGDLTALTSSDLKGFNAVIHSAAVTPGSSQEADFMEVNDQGTRHLVVVCGKAGVGRFVHISTMAVEADRDDAYARSKREAERHVQASALCWTIIRPGAVYGLNESWISYLRLMEKKWLIPVIGDGEHLLHQIYVKDCASAIVGIVPKVISLGKIYYAAAEPITYNHYLSVLRSMLPGHFRKIHIAMWMGKFYAAGMKHLLRSPKPQYSDNPRRDLSLGSAIRLDSDPRSFEKGLADMLSELAPGNLGLELTHKD
jgi:nucleoside-diphosphate-sugar epimerase